MANQVEVEGIVKRIAEGYAPLRIILFGSHAWGQPDEDSDIDLLIVKETGGRIIDRWVAVRELIADPERRTPVEPIVVTPSELSQRLAAGDQFFQRILDQGKLLYAA